MQSYKFILFSNYLLQKKLSKYADVNLPYNSLTNALRRLCWM